MIPDDLVGTPEGSVAHFFEVAKTVQDRLLDACPADPGLCLYVPAHMILNCI
jgi:hypothetical protein